MGRAGNAGLDGAGELDIFEGNWSVYKDIIFKIRKTAKKLQNGLLGCCVWEAANLVRKRVQVVKQLLGLR
jgi:hypothetical protein